MLKKTAFTLMEVLITTGILALIAAASYTVLFTGSLFSNLSESQIESNARARIALERVLQELRLTNPSRVWFTNYNRTQETVVLRTTLSLGAGNLVKFQIPVVDSATGELILAIGNQLQWGTGTEANKYIAYFVDPLNLCLLRYTYNVSGSSVIDLQTTLIATQIDSINFTQNGNFITVTIAARATVAGKTSSQTLRSSIRLRNS
jgi:prepilin-type N-terminal cleavage/methylation domain-containing protein